MIEFDIKNYQPGDALYLWCLGRPCSIRQPGSSQDFRSARIYPCWTVSSSRLRRKPLWEPWMTRDQTAGVNG